MLMSKILILGTLVIIFAGLPSQNAQGAFVKIDDFESLTPGPIDEQNEWFADDQSSVVALDPADANNQVLSVLTASTFLFHDAEIPEGQDRMLFMRFRYEDQLNVSFGMSESSFPDQFGNFEPELSLTSTTDDLRISDGGTYSVLATLQPQHWYNCWLYIDNENDLTSVWLHDRPGEAATAADELGIDGRFEIPFRQGTLSDLQKIFIKTGGGDGVAGPLILDDIYVQNTEMVDLSYPVNSMSGVGDILSRVMLHSATPNPFNPQTTISFTVNFPQAVEVSVYDVSGDRIAVLADNYFTEGNHQVPWDGTDSAGQAVSSGIYFVRLGTETETEVAKVMLVR